MFSPYAVHFGGEALNLMIIGFDLCAYGLCETFITTFNYKGFDPLCQ
jgi:hypothetical protein